MLLAGFTPGKLGAAVKNRSLVLLWVIIVETRVRRCCCWLPMATGRGENKWERELPSKSGHSGLCA